MTIAEELPLIRVTCLHLSGTFASAGQLVIKQREIVYSPSRRLDRFFGARAHVISIEAIVDLHFGGVNRALTISTGNRQYRYIGSEVVHVYERLKALVDHARGVDNTRYEPGERVLLIGRIYRVVMGFLGARGTVIVTDRRLRFEAGPGLERHIWPELDLSLPFSSIHSTTIQGVRRRLKIQGSDTSVEFCGAIVSLLHGVLISKGVGDPDADSQEKWLGVWPVKLISGVLMSPGNLSLSSSRLHFEPSGRLDAAIGVEGLTLEWSEVRGIRVTGWAQKRICLLTRNNAEIMIDVDNPAARFLDLVPLLTRARASGNPVPDSEGIYSAGPAGYILDSWRGLLGIGDRERVVMGAPAVHWEDDWFVQRGWLVLTARHLCFVPWLRSQDAREAMAVPIEHIKATQQPTDDAGRLVVTTDEFERVFSPLNGKLVAERFWIMSQGTERWTPTESESMLGVVPFVELSQQGTLLASCRPGKVITHEDGVGVFFPGTPPATISPGANLCARIASPDGLYLIDGVVVSTERITSTEAGGYTGMTLIVIAHKPQVDIVNRRTEFRVSVNTRVSLRKKAYSSSGWIDTSSILECRLVNLSLGGCAVVSDVEIGSRSPLTICLPPRRDPILLEGRVLDCKKKPGNDSHWHVRIQFVDMTEELQRRLGLQLIRFQESEA